ncbi:hypothetical protein NKH86_30550 [Mesorhizobium sp. M0913]|uniref:hypothetical protein n=1 Tax=Mesorhizobium sp. M0913 TaxID=2957026 RepID=UPI003335BF10
MGIPRVKARVVQSAVKTLVEPIFEAQFWHVSYGFGPGRSTHGALSISAGLPSRINAAGIPEARDTTSVGHRGRHQGLL